MPKTIEVKLKEIYSNEKVKYKEALQEQIYEQAEIARENCKARNQVIIQMEEKFNKRLDQLQEQLTEYDFQLNEDCLLECSCCKATHQDTLFDSKCHKCFIKSKIELFKEWK